MHQLDGGGASQREAWYSQRNQAEIKGELMLKDWDAEWSWGREDEKENFYLLKILTPGRCCKCWSWWGKEGRAQGKKSGLSLAFCCSQSLGSWWVTWIITLLEWYAEEWSHCYQCCFFSIWLIFFFKNFLVFELEIGENAVCLVGKLLEAVQNAGCGPTEEQPDMPV